MTNYKREITCKRHFGHGSSASTVAFDWQADFLLVFYSDLRSKIAEPLSSLSHLKPMSTGSAVYVLPRTWTKYGERGFFYSSPAAWNTLPSDLRDITDASTFRQRLKSVLLIVLSAYHWRRSWAAPYKFRVAVELKLKVSRTTKIEEGEEEQRNPLPQKKKKIPRNVYTAALITQRG